MKSSDEIKMVRLNLNILNIIKTMFIYYCLVYATFLF